MRQLTLTNDQFDFKEGNPTRQLTLTNDQFAYLFVHLEEVVEYLEGELDITKDYKGAVDPKKRSRNRKEERLKGGATKVTIEKVRKGGDKTITKSTTKIKRKKSDTFYRQEKPLSKRKKKKEKAGKMR